MEKLFFETSGSTGIPKTHEYSRDILKEEADALRAYFADRKRVVAIVHMRHIFGYVMGTVLPERLGVPKLHLPPLPVAELFDALRPGDLLVAFPLFWQAVLERFSMCGSRVADIVGLTASSPCPPEVIKGLTSPSPGAVYLIAPPCLEIYGSTETSAIGIRVFPDAPYTLLPVWERTVFTDGSFGIARVRADGSRETSVPFPDNVDWHGDRLLVPVKRRDNAVQVGGINVYPFRVAEIIRGHPYVKDCAVRLMRPEEGVWLKAFIVPEDSVAHAGKSAFGKRVQSLAARTAETRRDAEIHYVRGSSSHYGYREKQRLEYKTVKDAACVNLPLSPEAAEESARPCAQFSPGPGTIYGSTTAMSTPRPNVLRRKCCPLAANASFALRCRRSCRVQGCAGPLLAERTPYVLVNNAGFARDGVFAMMPPGGLAGGYPRAS
jgi:4-coumarate--CoA ligase (photoactive yellow protein activation family)